MPSISRMVRSLEQAPIWEANACSVCSVRYHGWNAFRRTKSSGATTQPTYTVRHGQTIKCAPMPVPTPAKPRRLTQQPVHAPFSPSLAASRRHHQCPQPALPTSAKPSEVNTIRSDTGRRTFRGTRPNRDTAPFCRPPGSLLDHHRRSLHSVTWQPHTPSVATDRQQTSAKHPQSCPLQNFSQTLRPGPPSPHRPLWRGLARILPGV